jgi:DNA repair protein RadA/Sms
VSDPGYACKRCYARVEGYAHKCPSCGRLGTLVPADEARDLPVRAGDDAGEAASLHQSELRAVNRALSGLASGAVYLLGGEPGSGKSTLGAQLCEEYEDSIYITAEEAREQVTARCRRIGAPDVRVVATKDLDAAIGMVESVRGGFAVIDSLQKITRGRLQESKDAIVKLCDIAKERAVTLLIINHVTKDDDIAGPRMVEHECDVVALLKKFGDSGRILRAKKNRYGVEKSGWLRMTAEGLADGGPELELPERGIVGRVLAVDRDGVPREVQAAKNGGDLTVGISGKRASMVLSILAQELCYPESSIEPAVLADKAWTVRADSDELEDDDGADLAIAVAVASVLAEVALEPNVAVWGALSLDGRVMATEGDDARADSAEDAGLEVAHGKTLEKVLDKLGIGISP